MLTYESGRSTHGEVVGEVRRERQARRGEHAAGARVHAQRPAGDAPRARAVAHRAVGARVAVQRRHLVGISGERVRSANELLQTFINFVLSFLLL